MAGLGYSGR